MLESRANRELCRNGNSLSTWMGDKSDTAIKKVSRAGANVFFKACNPRSPELRVFLYGRRSRNNQTNIIQYDAASG
jgi:hypothetical protein